MRGDYSLLVAVVLVFLLVSPVIAVGSSTTERRRSIRIAIPIDTASRAVWTQAIAGAPAVGLIIYNPSNGPGVQPDHRFGSAVAKAQQAGIKVVGYIYTRYANGSVSVEQAERQIDRYFDWYNVDGIFFDQSSSSCAQHPSDFYSTLFVYAKTKGPNTLVVLNPGITPGECYASHADILLTFENTFPAYRERYIQVNWTSGYPSDRFYHLVLGAPDETAMKWSIDAGMFRGVGWMYVTSFDTSKGNPYDTLPPYFEQEVAYVNSLNGQGNPWSYPNGVYLPVLVIVTGVVSACVLLLARAGLSRKAGALRARDEFFSANPSGRLGQLEDFPLRERGRHLDGRLCLLL